MKRFLLSVVGLMAAAVAAFGAAPARAADLPAALYKAPSLAPATNWTGFYIGVNGGGGIARGSFNDPCFTCADLNISAPFGTAGGQLGFNWQWRALVLGIEGDYNWMNAKKTLLNAAGDSCCIGTATFKMDSFASIRGRMGLAYDNALIYITAGAVWGHFDSNVALCVSPLCDPRVTTAIQATSTSNGWQPGVVVGAGTEFLLTQNLTLRGEVLYMLFKDDNTNYISRATGLPVPCGGRGGVFGTASCGINYNNEAAVARLALNWKFF